MARLYHVIVPFGRATNHYGKNHNQYEKAWFHAYKDTKKTNLTPARKRFVLDGCQIHYALSNNPRKSHKRQGQDACRNQGDGGALHALGRLHEVDVLTDASEDDQCHGETEGDADGIDDGLAKAQHVGHATIVELLGNHSQRHAQDGAVRRNQRQEHT